MKTNGRVRIKIPENAKRNPHFFIDESALSVKDGAVIEMSFNGRPVEVTMTARMISYVRTLGYMHRGAETRGSLRYMLPTFSSFSEFLDTLKADRFAKFAVGGASNPVTNVALAYLAYASLPTWARDRAAYNAKWRSQALTYPFCSTAQWVPA